MKGYRLLVLFMSVLFVQGCFDASNDGRSVVTALTTQASSQAALVASQYKVIMSFKGEGQTQAQAMASLSSIINPFEIWLDSKSFSKVAGLANARGVYQYQPNEKRTLIGYESRQDFIIEGLKFSEYQLLMKKGAEFNPENMRLESVVASDKDRDGATAELIEQVFQKSQKKASAMAKAANLCGLSVLDMSERVHDQPQPRMMSMAMDSEAVHSTQSKQEIKVTLHVTWQAVACGH